MLDRKKEKQPVIAIKPRRPSACYGWSRFNRTGNIGMSNSVPKLRLN